MGLFSLIRLGSARLRDFPPCNRWFFVLGAGANKPYGYPLAGELVDLIAYDKPADQSPLKTREDFAQLQTNLANSKAR
jgi:hypothetical protein